MRLSLLILLCKTMAALSTFAAAAVATGIGAPSPRIVIVGGGIHGASIAYHLKSLFSLPSIIVEKTAVAAAASGKSGGFLARSWGSGPTIALHEKSFDLHVQLAAELHVESFRRVGVLSVSGARKGANGVSWLDRTSTSAEMEGPAAQVTPRELTEKLVAASGCEVLIGSVVGVEMQPSLGEEGATGGAGAAAGAAVGAAVGGDSVGVGGTGSGQKGKRRVTGVRLADGRTLPCDHLILAAGPWTGVLVEDLFGLPCPMEGVKSSSVVLAGGARVQSEFAALFCEEDANGCHLEVYPRPNGDLYLCGLGGSDHVSGARLRAGGDCYSPESIGADGARVAAGMRTFKGLSTLGDAVPVVEQACMRPLHPDGLPTMGRVGDIDGAYLSCGHNCWGILWAPVSGRAVAELVATGHSSTIDLSPFSFSRFMKEKGRRGRSRGRWR